MSKSSGFGPDGGGVLCSGGVYGSGGVTVALARDCIFGRDELMKSSMRGRHGYDALDPEKLEYIKALIRSRVPNKPKVEFEYIWGLCRVSLGKSCQGLRTSAKKKQIKLKVQTVSADCTADGLEFIAFSFLLTIFHLFVRSFVSIDSLCC